MLSKLAAWHPFSLVVALLAITIVPAESQIVVPAGTTVPVVIGAAATADFEMRGGALAVGPLTLTGTINLVESSTISRPRNPLQSDNRGGPFEIALGPTNLDGPIVGAGGLILANLSRDDLYVNSDNSYEDETRLTAGSIITTSPAALGSAAGATTIDGASLSVRAPTAERFRIDSGKLVFQAGDFIPADPLTVAGGEVRLPNRSLYENPIVVAEGPGGKVVFSYDEGASWTGGSSGVGDLTLEGRLSVDAPLTHDGDLTIDGVRLNATNSYTGKTTITGRYVIDRSDVFGTSTTPIEILNADVTVLTLPNGDRGFKLLRGTLDIQTTDPINAPVVVGGVFEASVRGQGVFNGPVGYQTTPGGGYADLLGGVFNGPIRGDTPLRLGGEDGVTLNSANDIRSVVHIAGGITTVNNADALPLASTLVQGGRLEFNTPIARLPILKRYPYADRQTGVVALRAAQTFGSLEFLGEGGLQNDAAVVFERLISANGQITTGPGGSVEVTEELVASGQSSLAGVLIGGGNLRATNGNLAISGDLSGFTGDLIAQSGTIVLGLNADRNGPVPLNPDSTIYIGPHAGVQFAGGNAVIENNIYLDRSQGLTRFDGPLRRSGSASLTLAGRLFVGTGGTVLTDSLQITGALVGRDLAFRGQPSTFVGLRVFSPQTELTGDLFVRDGVVELDQDGALRALDTIRLDRRGSLIISSPSSGPIDRIGDATAVHVRGSQITLYNYQQPTGSETLGSLRLEGGLNQILATPAAPLVIGSLQREPGSLLRFSDHAGEGGVQVSGREPGMLGGWAVTERGFASLDSAGRFYTTQATSANLNTAGPSDHVAQGGPILLTSDRTVASLDNPPTGSPYALDLGGRRLTIASGGLFRSGVIRGGELTAGNGGPAELFLHQTQEVQASIVDNGADGEVALVVASRYPTTLSGDNSYSGGTWVVGDPRDDPAKLIIEGVAAIPRRDRVHLFDGYYEVRLDTPSVVEFESIEADGDSLISGGNVAYRADVYRLNGGRLAAPLAGDGTVMKSGPGVFEFLEGATSPEFTGEIQVREGRLRMEGARLPNATLVVEGGIVETAGNNFYASSDVVLDGGELKGQFGGSVSVVSDSTIVRDGSDSSFTMLRGPLSGSGDLTFRGVSADSTRYMGLFGDASGYTGDLLVESGALRIGAPTALGDGEVRVAESAMLILGSDRPSFGQTVLERDVHVSGGAIYATPPSSIGEPDIPNGSITGDVYVTDYASFGASRHGSFGNESVPGLVFEARVVLENGATVFGASNDNAFFFSTATPLVEIAGALEVGEGVVWNIEFAPLGVTGEIRSAAQYASIDFRGAPGLVNLEETTLVAREGQQLAVTINGESSALEPGGGLAGAGTLVGDYRLADGASVSPGASPGELGVLGDLTIRSGAAYEWELSDWRGGAGVAWDLLTVDGVLSIDATPEAPWFVAIDPATERLLVPGGEWLIASAGMISGFDPASIQFARTGLGGSSVGIEGLALQQRGDELYLVRAIPEPQTLVGLVGILLAEVTLSRRTRPLG